MKTPRRDFLKGTAAAALGAGLVSRAGAANLPEAPIRETAEMAPPLFPKTGPSYNPVVTLNGWSLPWRMNNGWKEFHLIAEPVRRQLAPGMTANLWGYNGQSPGPTIECVEGDRVRIFVTNKLPEHTTIHWHGILLPNGMDGVGGLNQPHIPVGKTFVYEFQMKHSGSFMYHPHADEMVQMAMGMMGNLVVHPRDPALNRVERDFAFIMAAYEIEPGAATPKVAEMLQFNLWTWNSRVFPGIDTLVVRRNDRVRVRIANLTMTNHPIHIHGHNLRVTITDGGWVPRSAQWPETTVDMPVGAVRAFEFVADNPGDWAFHCHKSHHVMNAMGHDVPTMIGVNHRGVAERISKLIPDYMLMGERGMADMGEMEMPLPDNTLPMMSGSGPFGAIEMGGMFTVMKVRDGLARNDYKDPGWYKHPAGTVAYEWKGEVPAATRQPPAPPGGTELRAKKPAGGHAGH